MVSKHVRVSRVTIASAVVFSVVAFGLLTAGTVMADDVGTGFTYQGFLVQGGSPVNNTCDFEFSLWDAVAAGGQIGSTQMLAVTVTDGLFDVNLDFGDDRFTGQPRWLQIDVCCPTGCSPALTPLLPRKELTPAPYSLRAANGVGGPDALNVGASDNVGIGTTSPARRLDVVGGPPISGTGFIATNDGSTAVTGLASDFASELHVGDTLIRSDEVTRLIVSINAPDPGTQELTVDFAYESDLSAVFEFQQPIIRLADNAGQTVFRIDAQGAGLGMVPVGAIIAWHRDIKDPVGGTDPLSLPSGWVRCDGQTLVDPESPLNGKAIPDLNGATSVLKRRFLRGTSGVSGATELDGTNKPVGWTVDDGSHSHQIQGGVGGGTSDALERASSAFSTVNTLGNGTAHDHNISGWDDETRPVNMSVVWIMRVK